MCAPVVAMSVFMSLLVQNKKLCNIDQSPVGFY